MPNKKLRTIHKRSVEYAQFRVFRVLSYALYAGFGVIIIASLWFLYTRMYQTIGQVETLAALTPVAGTQELEVKKFETVERMFEERISVNPPELSRDPFNVPPPPVEVEQEDTLISSPLTTTSTPQ